MYLGVNVLLKKILGNDSVFSTSFGFVKHKVGLMNEGNKAFIIFWSNRTKPNRNRNDA